METYFIILIILIILMTFYGGHNKLNKIHYETSYFKNLNNIIKYEQKIHKNIKNDINIPFEDITNKVNIQVIPNLQKVYYVDLNPFSSFTINNFNTDRNIMIIFNHHNIDLSIILKKDNNFNYLYNFNKKINVLDIYPIFNNNNFKIVLTVFIMKKPFWYY